MTGAIRPVVQWDMDAAPKKRLPTWAIVALLLVLVGLCCVWPLNVIWQGELLAMRTSSIAGLKQIGLAHATYVEQNDGFGPPPDRWADALIAAEANLQILRPSHFDLPLGGGAGQGSPQQEERFAYAYFRPLGGMPIARVQDPGEVPQAFDSSDTRWNANGDLSLLPDPPRWLGTNLVLFLNTHVTPVRTRPVVELKLIEPNP